MLVLFPLALVSLVAPFAGAWIEIVYAFTETAHIHVAPFAGAWIEIELQSSERDRQRIVAPFAGAWIEICSLSIITTSYASLPSRERGLKYVWHIRRRHAASVAPFAGAWIEIAQSPAFSSADKVAPFAEAWIEMNSIWRKREMHLSRSLRGSVD